MSSAVWRECGTGTSRTIPGFMSRSTERLAKEVRSQVNERRRRGLCEVDGRVLRVVALDANTALLRCPACGVEMEAGKKTVLYRLARDRHEQELRDADAAALALLFAGVRT